MRAAERRSGVAPFIVSVSVSAVTVSVVAVLGRWRSSGAPALIMFLVGFLPLLAAAAVWPLPALRDRKVPGYQRWFAAALAVAGCGQVLHAIGLLPAARGIGTAFPAPGDVVSLLAAPCAVAGVLTFARAVPSRTGLGWSAVRILLDALLLGLSLALLAWRFVFHSGQSLSGAGALATALAVLALVADLVVGCMAGLLALRRPAPHLLVAALGVGIVVIGYVLVLQRSLPHEAGWSRPGEVLLGAGWPLIAAGMLVHRAPPARLAEDPLDLDARVSAVTVTGTAAVLAVGVLAVLLGPPVDQASLGLVLVLLVVVWVREMLTSVQRTSLVRRLHAEAALDPLTGLANRRDLTRRLSRGPGRQPWCLLTLDLDAFKTVNDVLGHDTGDRLLKAVAARLLEVVPPRAVVARVGGDEFAVLLPATPGEAQRLGEGLVASVRRACTDVPGVERLGVSASVGLAAVPAPGPASDPLSALSAAGAAQQLAKAAGRDRVQLFDDEARRLRRRRLTVEERLRAAIAAREIELHYQPIVELHQGRLAGVEALARWVDAELGPVPPEEFVAVAEESGLVVPLGELVLNEALRQAAEAGLPAAGVRVSCNVSPLQLRVPGFDRVVEDALSASGMPPDCVVVEVTEAALVEEEGNALGTLNRLVELGVTVAIDDFGTGYSALGYLRWLPARILKIDKSLTASLLEEPRARAITKAVTELGRAMEMAVVVEGVECREVADRVRAMGAHYGQGSLFGAPVPLADVPGLDRLRDGPRVPSARTLGGTSGLTGPVADLSPAHQPR